MTFKELNKLLIKLLGIRLYPSSMPFTIWETVLARLHTTDEIRSVVRFGAGSAAAIFAYYLDETDTERKGLKLTSSPK